jgi:rhodanese-related sulfurtransferase
MKNIFNLSKAILLFSFVLTTLYGSEETVSGCSSSISKESAGCNSKNILLEDSKDISLIQEKSSPVKKIQTNISETLVSLDVNHKGKELKIIRNITNNQKSCPPYCIVPMYIEGVKTVGELETLDILKSMNEKEKRLVLDTRESKYYNRGTIPGAFNLPADMLLEDSNYFNDVISILGIEKVDGRWKVNDVHELLIFDDGITDNKAQKAIKSLLKLSYPPDKIFYYRGGFSSWKNLGLTIY